MTHPVLPLPDAPLDEVCERLPADHALRAPDRLQARLSPPEGAGWIALGPGRSVALVAPIRLTNGGEVLSALEVVAVEGQPSERVQLADALRQRLTFPLVAVGSAPPLPGLARRAALRHWVTGPDPFVPLQPTLAAWTEAHAGLAREREGRWGVQRSLARLRWRYEGADVTAMHVLQGERPVGWMTLRALPAPRRLRVVELHALHRTAHYALLKAARRLSWDLGALPVSLPGAVMSRRYAFTAGYLPSGRRVAVFGSATLPHGDYRAFASDVG
ncbi:MAG: hypothetical protein EA397_02500 [Deltaproteobacteria bacterium]|nr:MAG: hypothetical protein EA397_02500 [Deltaproteobacteria bacterium]